MVGRAETSEIGSGILPLWVDRPGSGDTGRVKCCPGWLAGPATRLQSTYGGIADNVRWTTSIIMSDPDLPIEITLQPVSAWLSTDLPSWATRTRFNARLFEREGVVVLTASDQAK